MIELVSSVNLAYWKRCGKRLVESFERFVSPEIPLRLYCDGGLEGLEPWQYEVSSLRVQTLDLGAIPGSREYVTLAAARTGKPWIADPSERLSSNGYDYRHDAVTFGKKGLATTDALRTSRAELLFWVDADTIFRMHVGGAFFQTILADTDIAYFGRMKPHTETGFIGFRVAAMGEFARLYGSCWHDGRIFDLPGWTDSDAFDWALGQCDLRKKNLSTQPEGHVIAASPIGQYVEHRKGNRKLAA